MFTLYIAPVLCEYFSKTQHFVYNENRFDQIQFSQQTYGAIIQSVAPAVPRSRVCIVRPFGRTGVAGAPSTESGNASEVGGKVTILFNYPTKRHAKVIVVIQIAISTATAPLRRSTKPPPNLSERKSLGGKCQVSLTIV